MRLFERSWLRKRMRRVPYPPPAHALRLAAPGEHGEARQPSTQRGGARTVYGRLGNLEVRLIRSRKDIKLAQRLRYEVFYNELSATPSLISHLRRRDEDAFDAVCDHLLVFDTAAGPHTGVSWTGRRKPQAVGTYRVLRQEIAARKHGFYSQGEYDIAPLIAARSPRYRFMELGRSCVLKPYRTKRTVELLWHGLWAYARQHKIDVMIGCASFEGTAPQEHAMAMSYLHYTHLAPPDWRARAHPHLRVPMDILPRESVQAKAALKGLPPLVKAYLRLGAFIGDGAVIDRQFGTTDVLIILPVENIDPRYFDYFGAPNEQPALGAVASRAG